MFIDLKYIKVTLLTIVMLIALIACSNNTLEEPVETPIETPIEQPDEVEIPIIEDPIIDEDVVEDELPVNEPEEPEEPTSPEEPKEPIEEDELEEVEVLPPIEGIDNYNYDIDTFINNINYARKNGSPCAPGGLNDIRWDDELAKAALNHCIDMAKNNYFSHTSLDGSSPWDRVGRTDFSGYALGENIAVGYTNTNIAIDGWLNSSGHCTNIMNSNATVMGYAWVYKGGSDWGFYYTMITGVDF